MKAASRRKTRTGEVVSDKMNKTVVVQISRAFTHPLYGKIMKREKNVKVHDEKNECQIGDIVRIEETPPLSKQKRWRVIQILKRQERA